DSARDQLQQLRLSGPVGASQHPAFPGPNGPADVLQDASTGAVQAHVLEAHLEISRGGMAHPGNWITVAVLGWVILRALEACTRLLDAHFVSLGIALLEIPLAWWSPPARIARMVRVEGAEHLRAAVARGQGVILLTAHFTPMEMAGRALASVAPVRFLYRPTRNEVLAYALSCFRCAHGGQGIPKDDIRAFIAALKNNECVWYAPDQSYRKKG